ncbi:Protein SCAI [Smittium culicis]|uniref:Protein SCAI n=1 Tax=Smittium culicis TaxID=133412 RepID=A0A1R1X337_9FUNG|nr:Protein SCAI [Smittium culicis]
MDLLPENNIPQTLDSPENPAPSQKPEIVSQDSLLSVPSKKADQHKALSESFEGKRDSSEKSANSKSIISRFSEPNLLSSSNSGNGAAALNKTPLISEKSDNDLKSLKYSKLPDDIETTDLSVIQENAVPETTKNDSQNKISIQDSKQFLNEPDKDLSSETINDIVEEFEYLIEKTLEIPATAQVTLQVYLLDYFQTSVLENPIYYGLERWEIGEIASKIAQLYYQYYFALIVKKLRFISRFILVCLLLNKDESVKSLLDSLRDLVDHYSTTFNPVDKAEWKLVVKEIESFTHAQNSLVPKNENSIPHSLNHSLTNNISSLNFYYSKPVLLEAVIIGNGYNQTKFSEITLDMFKMIHSLEHDSISENQSAQTPNFKESSVDNKYATDELLDTNNIKTSSNLMNDFKKETTIGEIDKSSCMLVYISSEVCNANSELSYPGYDSGLLTASRKQIERLNNINSKTTNYTYKNTNSVEPNSLYPADFIPFTRKPLFLIVESATSSSFKSIPRLFGQPLIILMSPTLIPEEIDFNSNASGNLYTIFLHSSAVGFCAISGISNISNPKWESLQKTFVELEDIIFENLSLALVANFNVFCFNLPSSSPDLLLFDYNAIGITSKLHSIIDEFGVSSKFNSSESKPEEQNPDLESIKINASENKPENYSTPSELLDNLHKSQSSLKSGIKSVSPTSNHDQLMNLQERTRNTSSNSEKAEENISSISANIESTKPELVLSDQDPEPHKGSLFAAVNESITSLNKDAQIIDN